MINLEYYRAFYYVAKLNSITLAAEELFISQPAVSQAIKNLEKALGGSLFFRTPKGVRLTPEGELLYSYVSQGYEYLIQAEARYKELIDLESGEVRIGASDMTLQFFLLPFLEQFNRQYPGIRIKVTNAPTPDTLEHLYAGRIDFGVVSSPVEALPDRQKGIVGAGKLKITPVQKIRDVFVANERFEELKGKTIDLRELEKYPLIFLEQNTSTRKHMDSFLKENSICLNPEFELATSELIVQFAVRGLGIGCVMENFAERQLDAESLFKLKLKRPVPERNICIATLDRLPMSPAGRKLLKSLMPT